MIWAKEETYSRDQIRSIQSEHLKKQVKCAYEKVPILRKKMDDEGLKPEDIKGIDDIAKLPFVVKDDFRQGYPFGLFAVEKKDLLRIHASSGTTGKPTVVGYTQRDMKHWTETVSRIAAMGGAQPGDVGQICFGYGMFTGALGLHYGLENMSIAIVPSSSGNTERQLMYMKDFDATVLVATPSYALHIAEVARGMGLDPGTDLKIRIGLFGGEGMSDGMRKEMNKLWGEDILFTQNYGMSELNGPGVAGECEHLTGMHIQEDHFYAEIIDPDTGEVLPEGSRGELVISCLTKEAIPLLRYRTKDITALHSEKCACGRTMIRMENLSGRSDDMLIIRGVNVFPTQIEEVILRFPELGPHYEIDIHTNNHLDNMEISMELLDDSILDSYQKLTNLEQTIKQRIRAQLGVASEIRLVPPSSLKRFEGKAKRVHDHR